MKSCNGRTPVSYFENHLGEVILSPDSGGTLLTWRCRFDSKIPGFGGLMKLFVTRFFRNALAGLESHAFPSRRP